jgi:uncharacterized delta-60 repeat protein
MRTTLHSFLACAMLLSNACFAADGDLDTTYNTPTGFNSVSFGASDQVYGGILQPDGKLIVVGGARPTTNQEMSAARFNADGTLDTTFGSGTGKFSIDVNPATTTDRATCGGLQSDGKIIIGGYSRTGSGNDDFAIFRLNTNGTLDTTFGTSGIAKVDFNGGTDRANALAVLPDNSIVITGSASDFNASADIDLALAKLTPNGALDTSFSGDGKLTVDLTDQTDTGNGITVQSDGKIVFCGFCQGTAGINISVVGRLTSTGVLDTTFGGGDGLYTATNTTTYDLKDVKVQADGKMVVVGSANVSNQLDGLMMRLTSAGDLDTSFNTTGILVFPFSTLGDVLYSVVIQADGKYVAGGFSLNTTPPNLTETVLVRVTSGGVPDSTFATAGIKKITLGSGNNRPVMIGQASDGKILVSMEGGASSAENFIAARFQNTVNVVASPTVTASTASVALGTTTAGTASTPAQSFTVGGSNLTANLVVTAPSGVELSKDSGSTWQTSETLTPSSGTVSTTTIQARIPASASAGSISGVNITCASTGATTQNISVTGTVNNPAPTLSSISPTSVTAGAGNTLLTVTGTNFINGSVIDFNGSALTTSFVSSTSLTATIPSASLATAGTPPVTVTTAAPGGGTSSSQTFTINAPAPTITGVNSSATDGSYKAGAVIPITVTFSVPVSVSGAPTLGLNSGGSATYASGTTTNILTFNYTVAALQNSGDLDYNSTSALALAGGTINATTGGTAATLTLPAPGAANSLGANKALVIDTTAPTVTSIVRQTPSGQTTALTTVTFLVTYSEPVLNASTSNFSVVAVNSTIVGTVQSVTGSGNTRAVTVNITSGTGEFRLRALN